MDELLSAKEAAALLGVHPVTIRKWVAQGKLTRVSRAGQYKLTHQEVERLRAEQQKGILPSGRVQRN